MQQPVSLLKVHLYQQKFWWFGFVIRTDLQEICKKSKMKLVSKFLLATLLKLFL